MVKITKKGTFEKMSQTHTCEDMTTDITWDPGLGKEHELKTKEI